MPFYNPRGKSPPSAAQVCNELQDLAHYTPIGFKYVIEKSNTQPGFIVKDTESGKRFLVTVIEV